MSENKVVSETAPQEPPPIDSAGINDKKRNISVFESAIDLEVSRAFNNGLSAFDVDNSLRDIAEVVYELYKQRVALDIGSEND